MTDLINELRKSRLRAYEADPGLIKEHFGIEQVVLAGGYGYRQVLELVQNAADAILEAHEAGMDHGEQPRIEVLLADSYLYVANTGAPFSKEGIDALLRSHSSPKRGNQIGRFGLGFKSLLRLGGKIDITSGAVAFGFNAERCRSELKDQFKAQEAPGLRLAWPLDESRAKSLRSRFSWATTVVCAEIKTECLFDHLRSEIANFPAEFLLFLPVSINLVLNDSRNAERRLHRACNGLDVILDDGKTKSRWRVVEKEIRITDPRAKDDATHVHTRDAVPLAWAIPLESKHEEAGRFWAFFPTHTPTYLPGILNAPWKLNSDRNAIISGEWNKALMKEAANLIAEALPQLSIDTDPGCVLDAFPRQLERADEDAATLVEALWASLETAAIIPDVTGALRSGRELWRHPRDNADLACRWQALAEERELSKMVHPSCLIKQRGSRLKALAARLEPDGQPALPQPNLQPRDPKEWFAAVATLEKARAVKVLKLADAYAEDCTPGDWSPIRPLLAVVPSDDDKLLTPDQAVFAPEGTHVPNGRHPVAKWLGEDAEAKRILTDVLKVKPLDNSVWIEVLRGALYGIPNYPSDAKNRGWLLFWTLLRAATPAIAQQFVSANRSQIRVMRRDGKWALGDEVLFPGSLVRADDSSNQNVLVDAGIHGSDTELLVQLGVCELPDGVVPVSNFGSLDDWLWHWRNHYRRNVNGRASWNYLEPSGLMLPKGWHFLPYLTGTANADLTARLLAAVGGNDFPPSVKFGHATVATYPDIDVSHPLAWLLLKHGFLRIGDTTVRLGAIAARFHEPAIAKLPTCPELQLAIEKLKRAIPCATASSDHIHAMWQALIKALATPTALANDSLRELWSGAARDKNVPSSLPTNGGDVPLTQIFVTGSPDLARRARSQGPVAVTLDADALSLWLAHGARDLSELMKPVWDEATGPATLLVATVPELAEVLRPEVANDPRCQPVAGLKLLVADDASPVPCLMWGNTLLLDTVQLKLLSRAERLEHLLAEAAAAGWLSHDTDEALRVLGDARVDELRAYVAEGSSLAERLLRAVSNREEPLRQALGSVGGLDFVHGCAPLQLAELVLAQLGPTTLTALKETLDQEGLKPPSRWNTAEARTFAASIGFPVEFAASPESRREAEEFISGPIELLPLHDFQQEVLEGIRELIASGTMRRRAVVSLPTGGGKTWVTVEAAVLLILGPEHSRRNVIWVAQTDELCEQAVQALRQVWLNRGAQRTDLRIIRLWGGNPTPAIQESEKPVVVVASIQTLNSRIGTAGLEWLQTPGLVVVDECHHAITPSYTNLLRFLDAEAPKPGAPPNDEPPILGLSATPFRTDDEESSRLARRFNNRWLPPNQEDLHRRLRRQGVLAEVENDALESGIGLTPDEIERLSKLPEPWEGIHFENLLEAINQRLAGNKERNERLVKRIQSAEEGSILLFANSVLHAEEIAARLNLQGIPAAAISGATPTAARRYFLSRFQQGEIRVLCNHTVLSTGFDAPKIDMVLISRAVFSPVRYMQMVGRGLRGEKNGGKARCRIVTVLDNLGRFRDRHPYHYCQKYFTEAADNG